MRNSFDQFEQLEKEMDATEKKTLSQKDVLVKKNNELKRRMLKLYESLDRIAEMYNELQERISDIYRLTEEHLEEYERLMAMYGQAIRCQKDASALIWKKESTRNYTKILRKSMSELADLALIVYEISLRQFPA